MIDELIDENVEDLVNDHVCSRSVHPNGFAWLTGGTSSTKT